MAGQSGSSDAAGDHRFNLLLGNRYRSPLRQRFDRPHEALAQAFADGLTVLILEQVRALKINQPLGKAAVPIVGKIDR